LDWQLKEGLTNLKIERKENSILTNDTVSCICVVKNGSQSKITNFHLTMVAINKNVITLKISMNDRRVMAVEIEKAF